MSLISVTIIICELDNGIPQYLDYNTRMPKNKIHFPDMNINDLMLVG